MGFYDISIKRKLALFALVLFFLTFVLHFRYSNRAKVNKLYLVDVKSGLTQSRQKGLVIVVHGWIDRGEGSWPEDMAVSISERVDANEWVCGYFDWSGGAKRFDPTEAARYGRDVAGVELADDIVEKFNDIEHIHMIGHSGGCWIISEAARKIAEKMRADLHLTFLDAYVPPGWDSALLGKVATGEGIRIWAEHYYTRDYTLGWTEGDLRNAHNVDVSDFDIGIKDHRFPWRWYFATITDSYPESIFEDGRDWHYVVNGVEYGFSRSREACGEDGWFGSLKLALGNKAIKRAGIE